MTTSAPGFAAARCVAVDDETHDVKTFTWRLEDGRRLEHAAGQHITLEIPAGDVLQFRCYTVSSPLLTDNTFTITVKRAREGAVSRWLHDHVLPGTTLRLTGPAGTFVAPSDNAPLLLVSGGVGITPLIAMVRHLRTTWRTGDPEPDVVFVQCARTPDDVLFHNELIELSREWPAFRVHEVISRTAQGGRLTGAALSRLVPDAARRKVYCCGPEPFMRDVRSLLLDMGLPDVAYHEESFTLPVLDARAEGPRGERYEVRYQRAERHAESTGDKTVLELASTVGLVIPSACRAGVCGTCRVRVLAGTVKMSDAGGIGEDEITDGYVLACCSRPTSDLVVDV
jgi:ferredoxin-NADP reductase